MVSLPSMCIGRLSAVLALTFRESHRKSDKVQVLLSSLDQQRATSEQFEESQDLHLRRRLVHGGTVLRSTHSTLWDYGIRNGSTVFELHSLVGGGGDGGTTANQRAFNEQHGKVKKVVVRDLSDEQRARWLHCAASGLPLNEPIVACELGYIFNKEEVMKQLLTKMLHSNFSHIRKMKDLFEIKLAKSPDLDPSKSHAETTSNTQTTRFECPITHRPTNGKTPFVAIKPCGHVLSEQCIKQVGGIRARARTHTHTNIFMYVYIHTCTDTQERREREREREREIHTHTHAHTHTKPCGQVFKV